MTKREYPAEVRDDEFRTPTASGGKYQTHGNCVAVAINERGVFVRNSNDSSRVTVRFTHEEWRVFVKNVKLGEFDLSEAQIHTPKLDPVPSRTFERIHGFVGPTMCACGATIPPGDDICPNGRVQI